MEPDAINEILSWIPYNEAEITIEGNPEELSFEQLKGGVHLNERAL